MKYIVDVGGEEIAVEINGGDVRVDGTPVSASLEAITGSPMHLLRVGSRAERVGVWRQAERGSYRVALAGWQLPVMALDERTRTIRDLAVAAQSARGPAPLVAPMPGMVVRIGVTVGEVVAAGHGVLVVEAMKMENELRATATGRVVAIRAAAGQAVEKGAVLVEFEAV
jgi:pyruvate carboxylase subunit B